MEEHLPTTTDEILANGDRLLARSHRLLAMLDEVLKDTDGDVVVDLRTTSS